MSMRKPKRPMLVMVLLTFALLFLSLGGFYGGVIFLVDPSGAGLGMLQSALERTPFVNYLVPGLILVLLFGVGSLVALYGLWTRPQWDLLRSLTRFTHEHWAWDFVLALGLVLLVWLVFQVVALPEVAPIQLVMFVVAAALVVLPLLPGMRRYFAE